jgi:hypothetical protein
VKLITVFLALILIGCGTIKETTTTSTDAIKIPATVVHDTVGIPVELPLRDSQIDSIGRWYLETYCKGTTEVDQNGLKATVSFYTKTVQVQRDSLNAKSKMIIQMQTDLEEKEKTIQATKKTTETKETPGDWWIFWASAKFWIPAIFLGMIILIVLRVSVPIAKKFIP